MSGDTEAYDDLIRRHQGLIMSEVVRVLRRHPDVNVETDDVMSDVLIQVWRSADRIIAANSPTAYLRQLVRHVAERSVDSELRHCRHIEWVTIME